jgi:glycosyltransferase involved in cell wall biosynthesis
MKIGIDAHSVGTASGGNETYVRGLLRALYNYEPRLDITAITGPVPPTEVTQFARFPVYGLSWNSPFLRVPLLLPLAARRLKLDLLHIQYNAPPWCPCPFVASVHDIVWERYPESLPASMRYRLAKLTPGTLRRARRILVLTQALRDEIASHYKISEDRFNIVQPAVDPSFKRIEDTAKLETVRARYNLPQKYILYVGALQPRKNIARLCHAFARIAPRYPDLSLVIVGKRVWLANETLKDVDTLKVGKQLRFTGYVLPQDLGAIMNMASIFAYVSLYEGFGIPVLEAMTCGIPCLISNDPALMEITAGAACDCDPHSLDSIEAGLMRLVDDSDLRATLSKAGMERAKYFTQEKLAKEAALAYEQARS